MPEQFHLESRLYASYALIADAPQPAKHTLEVRLYEGDPGDGGTILTLGTGGYQHLEVPPDKIEIEPDGLISLPMDDIFYDPIPDGESWSHVPTWARILVKGSNARILVDIDIQDLDMIPNSENRVRLVKYAFRLRPMP